MKQLKTTPPPIQKRDLQYTYDVTSHWFQYQVSGVFIKYVCHITVHSTYRQTVELMKKRHQCKSKPHLFNFVFIQVFLEMTEIISDIKRKCISMLVPSYKRQQQGGCMTKWGSDQMVKDFGLIVQSSTTVLRLSSPQLT